MRFMLTFRIPTQKGNALARDGTLGRTIRSVMEEKSDPRRRTSRTRKAPGAGTSS
jgi:hypothetical protein